MKDFGVKPIPCLVAAVLLVSFFSIWGDWVRGQEAIGENDTSSGDRSIGSRNRRARQKEEMPILLKGRVLEEDGTAPREPLSVELLCSGRVKQQAQLDVSGNFSFRLGTRSSQSDWADASVSRGGSAGMPDTKQIDRLGGDSAVGALGLDHSDLSGCEIRVSTRPGYAANSIRLGMRGAFEDPDVGTIYLHRLDDKGGTVVSLTTLAAPREAEKAYEKARKELSKKKANYSEVEKELTKAVKLYPEFAAAWHLLGRVLVVSKDSQGGREAFEQAIQADPRYIHPYIDLAVMAIQGQDWRRAAELTGSLLEVSPHMPKGLFFDGLSNYLLGNIERAERSLRRLDARGLSVEYPLTYFYLGVIDARAGKIMRAASEFRTYLKLTPQTQVPDEWREDIAVQLARWQEEGLIGKE